MIDFPECRHKRTHNIRISERHAMRYSGPISLFTRSLREGIDSEKELLDEQKTDACKYYTV
jgi:hypothetical protein